MHQVGVGQTTSVLAATSEEKETNDINNSITSSSSIKRGTEFNSPEINEYTRQQISNIFGSSREDGRILLKPFFYHPVINAKVLQISTNNISKNQMMKMMHQFHLHPPHLPQQSNSFLKRMRALHYLNRCCFHSTLCFSVSIFTYYYFCCLSCGFGLVWFGLVCGSRLTVR